MTISTSTFETRKLFDMPDGVTVAGVTAAGDVFGLAQGADGRPRFVWNGRAGDPIDAVPQTRQGRRTFWSDDGRHLALMARRGESQVVIRDGVEEGPYDSVSTSVPPTFSPDGLHLVYGAQTGGAVRLIRDGAPINDTDLAPVEAVFSPDGARLAFAEMRAIDKHHEYRIVVDDQAGSWFVGLRNARGALQFSPDGRRFAYYRIDGKGMGQWVVDGVAQRVVNDQRPLGLAQVRGVGVLDPRLPAVFSADSRRFAYEADVIEKGVAVLEDDRPGPLVRASRMPVFSPDSEHVAYGVQLFDKRAGVVLDGTLDTSVQLISIGDPAFSPDSRHVATPVTIDQRGLFKKVSRMAMLRDGQLMGAAECDDVAGHPQWSPDSREVAWWQQLRPGVMRVMRDDRQVDEIEQISGETAFTARGGLVYARKRSDGWSVTLDGRSGPTAFEIGYVENPERSFGKDQSIPVLRLSPDGEHVAWIGTLGASQHPVLDDRVGPPFDVIVGCETGDDGVMRWWGQRDREVAVVEAAWS